MAIETLAVTISSASTWTRTGGTNYTDAVAKPDDADTSYVRCASSTNAVIEYTVNDPVVIQAGDTINSVTVRARGRIESTTISTAEVRMSSNAWSNQLTHGLGWIITYGDDVSLTSTTRPQGGAWTLSDVNSLLLRVMGDDFENIRMTTLTVDVNYTAAPAAIPATFTGILSVTGVSSITH